MKKLLFLVVVAFVFVLGAVPAGAASEFCSSHNATVECTGRMAMACGWVGDATLQHVHVATWEISEWGTGKSLLMCSGTCGPGEGWNDICRNLGGAGSGDGNGDGTISPCEEVPPRCEFCPNCDLCPTNQHCLP